MFFSIFQSIKVFCFDVTIFEYYWNQHVYDAYELVHDTDIKKAERKRAHDLFAIDEKDRTDAEKQEIGRLPGYVVGFCLAGYHVSDRVPAAYEVVYDISSTGLKPPVPLLPGKLNCWGMPNIHQRLFFGIDLEIYGKILRSNFWTGTDQDLADIVNQHVYAPVGSIPLRDAIDWIDSVIYSTIKGLKFSHLRQMCGGPTEIAVISSDRPFRWVHHKDFSSATGRNPHREA